jgi:hypothetical protein
MGLFGAGGSGFPGETSLDDMTPVLGEPDQTYQHPAVECRDWEGNVNVTPNRAFTARWGDLFVMFQSDRRMLAYLYGPPRASYPVASYDNVSLGSPLSDLLQDSAAYLDGRVTPYGSLWRVHSLAPGIAGFASGSGPDAAVTHIFIGVSNACFGLPVDD